MKMSIPYKSVEKIASVGVIGFCLFLLVLAHYPEERVSASAGGSVAVSLMNHDPLYGYVQFLVQIKGRPVDEALIYKNEDFELRYKDVELGEGCWKLIVMPEEKDGWLAMKLPDDRCETLNKRR